MILLNNLQTSNSQHNIIAGEFQEIGFFIHVFNFIKGVT